MGEAIAVVILLVSALNAAVGGVQRFGAERAIVELSEVSQTSVAVLRHGEMSLDAADRLVPGDVVALRAGDSVPADCRVLEAETLERAIVPRAASTALGAGTAWAAARLTGRRRRAGTTALVALVGSQLGQTIAVGGHDPLVLLAGLGSAALLAGIVQTPGVSQFFGCTPLGPLAWSIAAGSSALATITATLASP